jgi:ABC-2 type transport system permease protein
VTGRTIFLIARRELNVKLRTKSFLVGTAVSIVVLAGFVLMQSTILSNGNEYAVGLTGQALAVRDQLTASAKQLGRQIEVKEVANQAAGEKDVADGELDALVSGPPAALQVLVKDSLDSDLRVALDGIVQQQVLRSQLAAIEDLNTNQLLGTVAGAHAGVHMLEGADPQHDQRLAIALLIIALLYISLALYGNLVAQGVIEEKSSRVVEILLATVRPSELLTGKILGLGLVGLAQLAVIGGVGLALAALTGVLTIGGVAAGTLLWGLFWYLLGYFLYATVFAAVGSLVARQEDAAGVITPLTLMLVVAFVASLSVLARDAAGTAATVLALIPPFSPILMPARIALGVAPAWQIGAAIPLTVLAIVLLALLGGRIYGRAILRMGTRVRLRDALR